MSLKHNAKAHPTETAKPLRVGVQRMVRGKTLDFLKFHLPLLLFFIGCCVILAGSKIRSGSLMMAGASVCIVAVASMLIF